MICGNIGMDCRRISRWNTKGQDVTCLGLLCEFEKFADLERQRNCEKTRLG